MRQIRLYSIALSLLWAGWGCDDAPSGPGASQDDMGPPGVGGQPGVDMGRGGMGGMGGLPMEECADDATSAARCAGESGVCAQGEATCVEGRWGPCQFPDTHQDDETRCDGLDNDCDGAIDEAFTGLGGPCDGDDDDACTGGTLVCSDDGTAVCEGDTPAFESCNGIDDDCDGATDEGLADPPMATMLAGVCAGSTQVCRDGAWADPDYSQLPDYEASEGTCDGLDNDCDERVDAGLFPPPAARQDGVCEGQVAVCDGEDGWVEPDYGEVRRFEGVEDSCDGLDNDCDGLTDESFTAPACALDLGVCARPRAPAACLGPAGFSDCDYGPDFEIDEDDTCDALDNDCDGVVDEGAPCPRDLKAVRVGPGVYLRGSPPDAPEARDDEGQHEVTITHPMLVRQTETAQAEWVRLMNENPSARRAADRPVESVTWRRAVAFANALSVDEGLTPCYEVDGETTRWPRGLDCEGWRLPTEGEWEYLARGGTETPRWTDDAGLALSDGAWHRANSDDRTQPVGTRAPNGFGLHDVLGNVNEWCWDRYGAYPDGPVIDPLGAEEGLERVGRGGAFPALPSLVRAASRVPFHPNSRNDDLGLRVVRSLRSGDDD